MGFICQVSFTLNSVVYSMLIACFSIGIFTTYLPNNFINCPFDLIRSR